MKKDKIIEYTCTECNSIVKKEDIVCPNCGADLSEEIIPAKFSKTSYRILFYISLPMVIGLTAGILVLLTNMIYGIFFNDIFLHWGISIIIILLLLMITANILFPFLFITQTKMKKLLIAISITIIALIVDFVIYYFNIFSLTTIITLLLLYELAFMKFSKAKKRGILLVLTSLLIICLFYSGVQKLIKLSKRNIIHKQVELKINYPRFLENLAKNKDAYFYSAITLQKNDLRNNDKVDMLKSLQYKLNKDGLNLSRYFSNIDSNSNNIIPKLNKMIINGLRQDSSIIKNRLRLLGITKSSIQIKLPQELSVTMEYDSSSKITPIISNLFLDSNIIEIKRIEGEKGTIDVMRKIDSAIATKIKKDNYLIDTTKRQMKGTDFALKHPLFSIAIIGISSIDSEGITKIYIEDSNRAKLKTILNDFEVKKIYLGNINFVQSAKPVSWLNGNAFYTLNCISEGQYLHGENISLIKVEINKKVHLPIITVKMNKEGIENWDSISETDTLKKFVILFNNLAFSPPLNIKRINNETFQISGSIGPQELKTIIMLLKAGEKMFPINIISIKNF